MNDLHHFAKGTSVEAGLLREILAYKKIEAPSYTRLTKLIQQCDAVANRLDLSPLEHVSPIERDNTVLYGQYILDRKLVRRRWRAKRFALSV